MGEPPADPADRPPADRRPPGRRVRGASGAQGSPRLGWRQLWPAPLVALLLLVFALLQGDVPDAFADLRELVGGFIDRNGAAAALALLYVEESGVPLPVPGDVYVVYLGSAAGASTGWLVAGWLAVVAVVVAGSSNLYLVSRRWGPELIEHRLAAVIHLDPERVRRARVWFDRWGPLAIIFGRHIPGFRIPITVVAGTFRVPYRVFAPSVAVSTAVWAAFWILLGARFGHHAADILHANPWIYLVLAGVLGLVIGLFAVRVWRVERRG